MRLSADESSRRCGELRRENGRLQQKCHDLGQQVSDLFSFPHLKEFWMGLMCLQVRLLLRELEEARGRVVRMDDTEVLPSTDSSSAACVITENLITFR